MPQVQYSALEAEETEELTLFAIPSPSSPASGASATTTIKSNDKNNLPLPFESSTQEINHSGLGGVGQLSHPSFFWLAWARALLAEMRKMTLISALCAIIAFLLFVVLLLLLLPHNYSTATLGSNVVKVAKLDAVDTGNVEKISALDHIPDSHERLHFTLFTRRVLGETTGHEIVSASHHHQDCIQALFDDHPNLKAKCTPKSVNTGKVRRVNNNTSTTYWRLVLTTQNEPNRFRQPFWLYIRNHMPHCLTVGNQFPFILRSEVCRKSAYPAKNQLFTLTVESLSVSQSRIYFALHSEKHPGKCVELIEDDTTKLGKTFQMKECSRLQATQLFYLNSVDFSEEFAEYQRELAEAEADADQPHFRNEEAG